MLFGFYGVGFPSCRRGIQARSLTLAEAAAIRQLGRGSSERHSTPPDQSGLSAATPGATGSGISVRRESLGFLQSSRFPRFQCGLAMSGGSYRIGSGFKPASLDEVAPALLPV